MSEVDQSQRKVTMYTPSCGRSLGWCAALMLAIGLVGCAEAVRDDVEIALRNPTAPLGGTSRFDRTRFAGAWKTVACLGRCAQSERYVAAPDGMYLRQTGDEVTPYQISAPGILRQVDSDGVLVVMWVDEGFRTAAIGDADGRWAAIIDRGNGSADRTRAAREILDFNGWDVSQLQEVK